MAVQKHEMAPESVAPVEKGAVRRRGLIAGAAALAAGLLATCIGSEAVDAADSSTLLLGAANNANNTEATLTTLTTPTAGSPLAPTAAGFRVLQSGVATPDTSFDASQGFATGANNSGIHGRNDALNGIGTTGVATNGTGVYGQSSSGSGVGGVSTSGAGMFGQSGSGIGVQGASTSSFGLYGSSATGIGVYGVTSGANVYGVLGQTTVANSTAIAGIAGADGTSAFSGGNLNPNAFAAFFQGHVQVAGPFDVTGAGNKHGVVPHPDGSHRTIYSIEAPEAWVEDFGTGTLVAGKAEVKIDPDFAVLIHTDDYHVFVNEHGDYHVHTPKRSATGFTVQVTSGTGPKTTGLAGTTGTFSWRIVARPKTDANVGRLAKVNMADATVLLPDLTKLPQPPKKPTIPQGRPAKTK
jgi:hypothetical protein